MSDRIEVNDLNLGYVHGKAAAARDIIDRFEEQPFTSRHLIVALKEIPRFRNLDIEDLTDCARKVVHSMVRRGELELATDIKPGKYNAPYYRKPR